MRRPMTGAALVVIVLLAVAGRFANAQSDCAGCPDLSFGTNGIVPIRSFGGAIGAIGVQHIGGEERIVALDTYRWKLARYRLLPQGGVELDTTFGTLGTVTHPSSLATANHGMVVQPDNKLVVAGALRGKNNKEPWVLMLVRYEENGSIDSGFGQNGTVTFPSYGGAQPPRLQPDGKLLLAVAVYPGNTHVIRLDEHGALDPTFGQDGVAVLQGLGTATAITVQPGVNGEDKIVVSTSISRPRQEIDPVTGQKVVISHYLASLIRFNSNGSLDTTFANGGTLESDEPGAESLHVEDVVVDRSGRIVVAGYIGHRTSGPYEYHTLVERYQVGGEFDFRFTESVHSIWLRNVLIGPDDKILAVGVPMPTYPVTRGLAVWRLLDDGGTDSTFGTQGLMLTTVVNNPFDSMWPGFDGGPRAAFLDGGSTFLVGGSAYVAQSKRVVTDVGALGRFRY